MQKRLIVIALAAAGSLALVFLALDLAAPQSNTTLAARGEEAGAPLLADRPVAPPTQAVVEEEVVEEPSLPRANETRTLATTGADAYADELAAARWVEVRVIFPAGTPPDEKAFVVASGRDFEHGPEHRVEVPPDGSFRIAFAKRTLQGTIQLEARYLYLEEMWRVDFRESVGELVLEPRLGGRIEGDLVLANEGDITPGDLDEGKVALERTVRFGGTWTTMGTFRSTPVQGLAFEFDAIPLGADYRVELDAEVAYGRQLGDLSIVAGETSEILVEVRPGVALEGHVLDEGSLPVPDVEVSASSFDSGSGLSTWRQATTDSDGAYAVRGLSPGKLTVQVEVDGFAPTKRELLPVGEGETIRGVDLVLTQGLEITGHVRWPDGSPASGAAIEVERSDPWFAETFTASEDGSFVANGLLDATYRLRARGERGKAEVVIAKSPHTGKEHKVEQRATWRAEAEDVPAGTSGLELVLDPGEVVVGFARDDLGRPLDAFDVEALSRQGRSFHMPHFSRFREEAVRRSFQGTGGRFELEGLTAGAWSIAAKAPGHVASEGRVLQVPADLADVIDLVVPRSGRIEGRVVDSGGRAVGNARVVLDDQDLPFSLNGETTNDGGYFVLEEVSPGGVVLHAESELSAPSEPLVVELEPGELVTGIELSLRRGGRITGRVVDALGTGIPGRDVNLNGASSEEATSDSSGQFAFENLPAGQYYLWSAATPEEIARFAPPESQEVFSILSRDASVQLEELGSAEVILAPPVLLPVRIHGRVTSSGQPLANTKLLAQCPSGFTSILADAEGLYELALPSPGSYSIQVDCERTGMQSTVEVDVPPVDRFAFDIEIATGTISGSVGDPDGTPVAGVRVIGKPVGEESEWRVSGETTTGPDGSFRLEVPAGTHDVAAGVRKPWDRVGGPFAPGRVRGIAVAPGQRISDIDIRLSRGGAIEGRIEIEGGGSLGRTWVRVADGEGRDAGQTMANAAGSFRIEGVPAGRMRIQAHDQEERVSSSTPVEVRADETSRVELILSKGTDLQARVVDASGAPIEVEAVELVDPAGDVIQVGSRQEDGTYALGIVPRGKHRVRARHLGRSFEQEVDAAGAGELTVDLLVQ